MVPDAGKDEGRGPLYGVIENLAEYESSLNLAGNVGAPGMNWTSSDKASSLHGSADEGDEDDDVTITACCAVSQEQQLLVVSLFPLVSGDVSHTSNRCSSRTCLGSFQVRSEASRSSASTTSCAARLQWAA